MHVKSLGQVWTIQREAAHLSGVDSVWVQMLVLPLTCLSKLLSLSVPQLSHL